MDLRITAAVVALLGSTSAFSAVILTVPEEIKMIAVNDQKYVQVYYAQIKLINWMRVRMRLVFVIMNFSSTMIILMTF